MQQFDLSTDRRKDRWAELDRYKYEKEAESSAVHMATEKRKREEEQHEIKRLRSEAVHQAKPVRQYNKVDIKRSERPLTRPETPRFSERLKSRIPDKSWGSQMYNWLIIYSAGAEFWHRWSFVTGRQLCIYMFIQF